jgi:serine O-acetyltransferase
MQSPLSALKQFGKAVTADYEQVRRYQEKYHGRAIPKWQILGDVVRKVGVQMTTAVRAMQALDESRVPLLPQVMSRAIRHIYGAEIHWKAKVEPGLTIIHGCGLVISHAATIGPGCILFQNVTLGESFDATTKRQGAPTLGRDVHVGPGATLLGPITIGDRTKIMAGAVVTQSVPPDSVVRPAATQVCSRLSQSSDAG